MTVNRAGKLASLEEAVGEALRKKGQTLAAAESCTGGLLSHRITNVPGSSEYFLQGVVTYSNLAKQHHLGVRRETLARCGAVSEEVAREMAEGMLRASGSDWALSITGIAGPTGKTGAKPLGLTHIALASRRNRTLCRRYLFFGSRLEVKERMVNSALDFLRREMRHA